MTDQTIAELEKALAEAKAKASHQEYPKWVLVHLSHVHTKLGGDGQEHFSVPAFPEFHVDRLTRLVSVLVHDAEDEAKALADPAAKPVEQKSLEKNPT